MPKFVRQRLFWLKRVIPCMGMYGFWSVLYKMHDTARHNIEIFAVLGCYAVLIGRFLPMFWGSLSVPSSKVMQSKRSLLGQDHSLL
jgi:hypothetical protein